ncbi:MAG: hypothetical protein V1862_11135 [Methanobacteriota archaeon]
MYYRIRFENISLQRPKNIWYIVTENEPRTYDTNEVLVEGPLGMKQDIIACSEGGYATFDLASQDIPDEYEDDGKGVFTDPRPVIHVSVWLQEDIDDIQAMSQSVIENYIIEKEEEADVEGFILTGNMREYIQDLRSGKKKTTP